jgi:hypothetical protein
MHSFSISDSITDDDERSFGQIMMLVANQQQNEHRQRQQELDKEQLERHQRYEEQHEEMRMQIQMHQTTMQQQQQFMTHSHTAHPQSSTMHPQVQHTAVIPALIPHIPHTSIGGHTFNDITQQEGEGRWIKEKGRPKNESISCC